MGHGCLETRRGRVPRNCRCQPSINSDATERLSSNLYERDRPPLKYVSQQGPEHPGLAFAPGSLFFALGKAASKSLLFQNPQLSPLWCDLRPLGSETAHRGPAYGLTFRREHACGRGMVCPASLTAEVRVCLSLRSVSVSLSARVSLCASMSVPGLLGTHTVAFWLPVLRHGVLEPDAAGHRTLGPQLTSSVVSSLPSELRSSYLSNALRQYRPVLGPWN